MAREKKKPIHYVNNKEFLEAIIQRKELLKEAEETGELAIDTETDSLDPHQANPCSRNN